MSRSCVGTLPAAFWDCLRRLVFVLLKGERSETNPQCAGGSGGD